MDDAVRLALIEHLPSILAAVSAVIIALATLCTAVFVFINGRNSATKGQVGEVHAMVNSNLTELRDDLRSTKAALLALTSKASFEAGIQQEKDIIK